MSERDRNIYTAHAQWATRPPEDRCASLDDFIGRAEADEIASREKVYNARDLRVEARGDASVDGGGSYPVLVTPKGAAEFGNWAFGQTARLCGAPAGYLATLPGRLAADCLEHGLRTRNGNTYDGIKLYARVPAADAPEGTLPTLRAITTDTYSRVTDAALARGLRRALIDGRPTGDDWRLPTAWDGRPAGAYRSDRDSFLILINGGSIVEDPSARQGEGAMYRGVMVSNSEVGARSVSIDAILFRYICGNLIVWGATYDSRYKRRHVGSVDRAALSEIASIAWRWSHTNTARDVALIRYMQQHEIAQTEQGIIDTLRAKPYGLTEEQARSAYRRAEQTETNPRSYWGISQGITRVSQDEPYTGDRVSLDTIAAGVLAKAARLARV